MNKNMVKELEAEIEQELITPNHVVSEMVFRDEERKINLNI